MVGKDAFQIKNKQNQLFHKRMFATTGASQARSPITMGATQRFAGGIIGFTVIALGAAFLHPFAHESSYAADTNIAVGYDGEDWTISTPTSTAADAGGLEFNIEGNPAGVNIAKKDIVTSGGTNVPNYQIYVSVNTEDGKIPATSGDAYIAATSGTVTDKANVSGAATLSTNSWGYALSSFSSINYDDLVSSSSSSSWSSSKWAKLPYVADANVEDKSTVEGTAAKIYDSTTDTGNSVNVYYGINANNDLASGEYRTTITYTLIGEMPVTTTYMQDMTASDCAALKEFSTADVAGTTYEVTDSRDKTPYYIRQFTFGSNKYCTMVENLNLAGGTTVTYKDTNITSSTTTYLPSGGTATGTYTLPTSGTSGYTSSDNSNTSQRMYDGNGRNRNGAKYNNNAVDGAYYNWQVATAGTGGSYGTSRASSGDICPKNWRLFTSSEYYNIISTINDLGIINNWFTNSDGTAAAASAPVYSGDMYSSALYDAGSYANWWSSTQNGNNGAYYIRAVSGSLITNNYYKYYGFSVRCLLPSS